MSQIKGYDNRDGGKIQIEFSNGVTIWIPIFEVEEAAERVKLFVGKRDDYIEPGKSGYSVATPKDEYDTQPVYYNAKKKMVLRIGNAAWYDAEEWKFIRELAVKL